MVSPPPDSRVSPLIILHQTTSSSSNVNGVFVDSPNFMASSTTATTTPTLLNFSIKRRNKTANINNSNMEEKRNTDQLQAVWLAAGLLAFMAASLERAALLYSVVKQWRSWVFIALNVLLLAILFTSKHAAFCSTDPSEITNAGDNCHGENDTDSKAETNKKLRKQQECRRVVADADHDGVHYHHNLKKVKSGGVSEDQSEKIIECDDGGGGGGSGKSVLPKQPLSNEELNERVEAFIATFRRQYLVSSVNGASRSGFYNSPASDSRGGILSESVTV